MSIKKRNFGLDLIRAIAILLVMISHLGFQPEYVGGLRIGQLGVEIFFVLSGFLIGGILVKDFSTGGVNMPVIGNFWIRRWFRTLPIYYLVLIVKFIFIDDSLGVNVLVYFFFLQNNFVGIDFLGVSWSLVIEEWFYLILPLSSFLLFYNRKFNLDQFLIFIIAFIGFENLMRFGWVLKTDRSYDAINGNFPFRLDSLMWGVLFAVVKSRYNQVYLWFSKWQIFILFLTLYFILLWYFGRENLVPGNIDTLVWTRTVWFTINSAFIATLIPYLEVNYIGKGSSTVFKRFITFISIISYSIYLIHTEVYLYIKTAPIFTLKWYGESLICIFLSLAIAALMYNFIEKPVMNLRDRIKIGPKRMVVN